MRIIIEGYTRMHVNTPLTAEHILQSEGGEEQNAKENTGTSKDKK
jgi:hypothetical protein